MQQIFYYIRDYIKWVNPMQFLIVSFFTAALVWFNYSAGLEHALATSTCYPIPAFTGHYLLFLAAFSLPYLLANYIWHLKIFKDPVFLFLLLLAPAIFALKMSLPVNFTFSANAFWNDYWNRVLYWPLLLCISTGLLFLCWKYFSSPSSFYGLSTNGFNPKPYLVMLVIMLPLIAAAATQPDFQHTYPKMKSILPFPEGTTRAGWYMLLYELAYGSDFFTIELFFRGFLVLAFVKWAGKNAILPMACFYCTIHFGKPLGECISSYFGGLLLGIVIYNNRSIFGGLLVHLGIAWLMELAGYIGTHWN